MFNANNIWNIVRKSAFVAAGGFNESLRYKEDQEMGKRLEKIGYFVIGDPNIKVFPTKSNGLLELMERYSRWYMDINDKPSIRGYLHNISASFRPMIEEDIKDGDYLAIFISVLVPHFQLFFSFKEYLGHICQKFLGKTKSIQS